MKQNIGYPISARLTKDGELQLKFENFRNIKTIFRILKRGYFAPTLTIETTKDIKNLLNSKED